MQYLKENALSQIKVQVVAQFLTLAGVAILLPFFMHVQWITGPIVNAILIIGLFLVGIRGAFIFALVPSLMALSGGLLPAILAPVVPFIMIGNVIFIFCVDWFYNNFKSEKYGYWTGIVVGAGLKFLFLFFSVNIIVKLLIKQELALKVAQLMSWPQFATALIGGMIAWVFLKFLKRI